MFLINSAMNAANTVKEYTQWGCGKLSQMLVSSTAKKTALVALVLFLSWQVYTYQMSAPQELNSTNPYQNAFNPLVGHDLNEAFGVCTNPSPEQFNYFTLDTHERLARSLINDSHFAPLAQKVSEACWDAKHLLHLNTKIGELLADPWYIVENQLTEIMGSLQNFKETTINPLNLMKAEGLQKQLSETLSYASQCLA